MYWILVEKMRAHEGCRISTLEVTAGWPIYTQRIQNVAVPQTEADFACCVLAPKLMHWDHIKYEGLPDVHIRAWTRAGVLSPLTCSRQASELDSRAALTHRM